MSKWKHPYVIKFCPGPRPEFHLMKYGYLHCYRKVESYTSLEKALKAKRKAYERSQK